MGLTGTTGGRPPLPARNFHQSTAKGGPRPATVASRRLTKSAVFTGGVPANPKSSLDRQDKDKSDRATHEQVLDSRTRLALSALTNRGVMGKLGYCISTGKEVS
jgi:RIO kinase 1